MDKRQAALLSEKYPTTEKAAAEIIGLQARLMLPKGTEYFFSDLHGENEAFIHLLKSASGVIRNKIDMVFGYTMQESERKALAALIYYPERMLKELHESETEFDEWFKVTVFRLIQLIKAVSEKCTREKVREKAPAEFAKIVDELLHVEYENKTLYYSGIIKTILQTGVEDSFIIGLCAMVRDISVDMLHIIGDIYDRGAHPDIIMDELMNFHDVDIQWGNHDINWIGAACGNLASMASVLRLGIRYNSFDLIEDGYGINLRPLYAFAEDVYGDDPCEIFMPKLYDKNKYDPVAPAVAAKMHKAMTVIQFKLEGQLYERHPEYGMSDRVMLKKINFDSGEITVDGKTYPLLDSRFPTVDKNDPLKLSKDEERLMDTISSSFRHSERLKRHVRFLYSNGGMFKSINGNLLYHGCIPMKADGEFDGITVDGKFLCGKELLVYIEEQVKNAIFSSHHSNYDNASRDFLWYLWCGAKSPLFGKEKMTTFEQYFIEDRSAAKEVRNPYYDMINDVGMCDKILEEFGLDPQNSQIVNGHVPVRIGESPVRAGGKLFIIDGGISKAYRSETGIGGYTLIYNSHSLAIAEHKPFISSSMDSSPEVSIVRSMEKRVLTGDTDEGAEIKIQIAELYELIEAYGSGMIKEKINGR